MHGNFNEMVTTVMTATEEREQSHNDSRFTEDPDENHVIKLELDVSIPSFEVELMKLRLVPGINQVANPATFEKWVTYAMLGMSMWLE